MNPSAAELDPQLASALRWSRYARQLVAAGSCPLEPAAFSRPFLRSRMRAALADPPSSSEDLARRLRKLRQGVMLCLIARDLSGRADLAEVVGTTTALAEETVRAALEFHHAALARQFGRPMGQGGEQRLHVIGMGKLGGEELNVSSDIDLIFAYPEEGETDGARKIANHEFFTRLARRLISALAEITDEGFVFRVDTRLRPNGDSGPLVVSFDMLEEYFYTQGREWERYAWVKARVIAGDREPELMALATPFVYRRHLDFSALESLRALHSQVRQEVLRRDIADNIKLGPGGIREIEFLVQVFQLIRGGRDTALRVRPTLAALEQLAARGLLPADAVAQLRAAYVFLRNLEHRLQYLDDRQTQTLPASAEDRLIIAQAMGFADPASFDRALAGHRSVVTGHFEAIFAANGNVRSDAANASWLQTLDPEQAAGRLQGLGYPDPASVLERLAGLRSGARYMRMSASGQARLDRLLPLVVEAAARFEGADATLTRLLHVIESIGRRESYLALLLEYPQALEALTRLAAASPWAADYLAQQPMLLDELIAAPGKAAPDWPRLRTELREAMDQSAGNIERQMDLLRHFKHAQTLRLLMQDLAGELPLETLSDHLSDLACAVLDEVLRQAWAGLRTRHREQPRFAVIGYGKLGGKELGYASDLDLIFLYDDAHEAAPEVYARLAQRINTWLTSATPAGVLYDTDLRLRPNGAAGLLVSNVDAFDDYQRKRAWVWEHQALTRARFVAGDQGVGSRFEAIRNAVLRMPRERRKLKAEVVQMRRKMREGHPNASGLFDLKHDPGGIVDVEFTVQYLVLGYAHAHPELTGNIGNLALLDLAARLALIPTPLARAVRAAYREFRARQHALRLQGERYARLPHAAVAGHARNVVELWNWVFEGDSV
ncbi:MAG TPA: bifunctional [glutamate--ammonia ligase]-adenylyl-L-tyrosine phosphorylase/[glutamate--ammonia-ligase] adenylyltransferase [Burkholderiales bacterium]|jgi:glutamate-ammonia-ligase adenylyltransferase|nr:bifunctional [glutamate--ammonia ligase]-adenylyl-L-tyrosine phosphorylase/[glutamate--ammonia-ligase] adenylyltransferase [Burkholderiales bacterium]